MNHNFKLFRLQQVDSQIDHIRARVRAIEVELSEDIQLRNAELEKTQTKKELQDMERKLKSAEADSEAQKIKMGQNQAALYGGKIRNPKELQDLQKEAQSLQRHMRELEDIQIDLMISLEEVTAIHDQSQKKLEEAQAKSAQRNALLRGEQNKNKTEIARLSSEREAVISTIPPDYLTQYEHLRKKKAGVAVSRVQDDACSSCGTTLNAVIVHAARSDQKITICDGCGRILYGG